MKLLTKLLIAVLLLITLQNCSIWKESLQTEGILKETQDSLAFELCQIYGSDQGIRDMKLITRKETGAMKLSPYLDSINFYKILDFIKTHGMPCEELLGKRNFKRECVELAPIAVLLHTPHIIVNNDEYLMFFADLVKKGELKEGTFLTILDKYYWVKNQGRVLYGSQFGMPHLVDKEITNKARAKLGIAPLADSLFIKRN